MTGWLQTFGFVALWLGVTTMLGWIGGWFRLQRRYPTRSETPLITLGGRSGTLGWVDLRGCLTLMACPNGLRLSVWRVFAPFQSAVEIPWTELQPTTERSLFRQRVVIRLGSPEVTTLAIAASAWEQLAAAAPVSLRSKLLVDVSSDP